MGDYFSVFYDVLSYIHFEFIPNRIISQQRNFQDYTLKKLYRRKCLKWKKYNISHLECDRINYSIADALYNNYIINKKTNIELKKFNDKTCNPKSFYNYINHHLSNGPSIPSLITINGLSIDDTQKCNTFSALFQQSFSIDNGRLPELTPCNILIPSDCPPVTPREVVEMVRLINVQSSVGPDSISPRFLKNCIANLAYPLSKIFNISINQSFIPDEWKIANITPIFKSGDRSNPLNYRPISITSVLSKLCELLIRQRMMQHITNNQLISNNQHGFYPNRSVSTNLINCLDDWSSSFDAATPTDIVYLDFRKAFDSVNHKIQAISSTIKIPVVSNAFDIAQQ